MKRIYGELKMNWMTILLFAVITGVYTGLIMLVPALENTSFQDIGIAYEWWEIFAVIIVVNCRKNWEAALKCFVFFLISQPLIYGVEVVVGSLPISQALYYFRLWLPMMLLTLPGGFLAFYCKKQSLFGSVILGIGNMIQAVMGISYLASALRSFPHHLLSAVVSFGSIFWMSFCIQKKAKCRAAAIVTPVVLTVGILIWAKMTGRGFW